MGYRPPAPHLAFLLCLLLYLELLHSYSKKQTGEGKEGTVCNFYYGQVDMYLVLLREPRMLFLLKFYSVATGLSSILGKSPIFIKNISIQLKQLLSISMDKWFYYLLVWLISNPYLEQIKGGDT